MAKNVVSLFQDKEEVVFDEIELDVQHDAEQDDRLSEVSSLDLSKSQKALMAIGPGGTGKTTMLRWICERALSRDDGTSAILATVDPTSRELSKYFPRVAFPSTTRGGHDPVAGVVSWLERLLSVMMDEGQSAAIDFGGGDTSLGRLIGQTPDLVAMMTEAGVEPVALYTLSPRVTDLNPLAALEAKRFQPRATALILNEGRIANPSSDPVTEFAQLRRHSAYKAVIDRGAVEIWMPRLFVAEKIEQRQIGFRQARDGIVPDGKNQQPLWPFDRRKVRYWMDDMERAFSPIASWLL